MVPSINATLFLALGLPKGLVNSFLAIYTRFNRLTSHLNWTSDTPVHIANGAIQGCSFSLLAMNVHMAHMAVWGIFLSNFPGATACAFIDDPHLWTKKTNLFLDTPLNYSVDILGVCVQTADWKQFNWDAKKMVKISNDIAAISALPCATPINQRASCCMINLYFWGHFGGGL